MRFMGAICAAALLLASSLNASGGQDKSAEVPSKRTVQAWWKIHSDEEMTIEGELLEVRLKTREVAYLAPVSLSPRGRNDTWQMVLVRPKLQAIREMEFPMRTATVRDLDHDGVSEVVVTQTGSGQGTSVVIDSIVHIDGWAARLLLQRRSGDNLGACGPPRSPPCKSIKVDWKFQDATEHDVAALTETITTSDGPSPEEELSHRKKGTVAPRTSTHETVHTTVNCYSFTGARFIRMKNASKE